MYLRQFSLIFLIFLSFSCFDRKAQGIPPATLARIRAQSISIAEATQTKPFGSGVLISSKLALTCYHVVKDRRGPILLKRDSTIGEMRTAKVIFFEPTIDLALLETEVPFPKTPLLRTSRQLRQGQSLFLIGAPYTLENSFLEGRVSDPVARGKDPTNPLIPYFQVQGLSYPGVSGAGIFDRYGRLVGIERSAFGFSPGTGIGFAIPWSWVADFLNLPDSPIQGFF